MRDLSYTLLSDGSSDRVLIPILSWLIKQHRDIPVQASWADLRRLRSPKDLPGRIRTCLEYYPCDLLFVHRDAEAEPLEKRVNEIHSALKDAVEEFTILNAAPVVPVRMTEAWLLFDETAIRHAAANPQGQTALSIPAVKNFEQVANPKSFLHELLVEVCELRGRRLKIFKRDIQKKVLRIPEFISDFSPLRNLLAFQALENELVQELDKLNS